MRPAYTVAVSYKLDDAASPMDHKVHPVLHEGRVAVITGAAGGIGQAAAIELAKCVVCHASSCDLSHRTHYCVRSD
jgi:NADPH-dependent curcumin reductase CurA